MIFDFFTFPKVKNDDSDDCERFFFTDLFFCVYLSALKPPDDIVVSNKIDKIKFFFYLKNHSLFITILVFKKIERGGADFYTSLPKCDRNLHPPPGNVCREITVLPELPQLW